MGLNFKILAIVLLSLSSICSHAQQQYLDKNNKPHLWGTVSLDDLKQAPFREWFDETYNNYSLPDLEVPNARSLKNLKVDIFLGTWCGDSKLWVPQFVALWNEMGLDAANLNFIGLHNNREQYKQGPNHEEAGFNIHRVPTFIFKKNEEEIGRIVERPINTLEIDFLQIANGMPSEPRYRAVSYLHEQLKTHILDSLYANSRTVIRAIRREVTTASELNTYGYVLKSAGRLEEALFVFKLNTLLFRHNPNTFDSLAETQLILEDYPAALENYQKTLNMLGEDERVAEVIEEIKEKIEAEE